MQNTQETQTPSQKPSLMRLVYMLMYVIIGRLASVGILFAGIFQFAYTWFKGETNKEVLTFTASLSDYAKQVVSYVSMNTEEKPWPLAQWPKAS